jgi:dTMP kinase
MTGKLFTYEGIEGAGKGTQKTLLEERLVKEGFDVSTLRFYEPGGDPFADLIRMILKRKIDKESQKRYSALSEYLEEFVIDPLTQSFLFFGARNHQYLTKIKQELLEGKIVLLDRSVDSTTAYQGYGQDPDLVDWIRMTNDLILRRAGINIDKTFFIDGPVELCLARANARDPGKKDYFERMGPETFEAIRNGYLAEAVRCRNLATTDVNYNRIAVIDGFGPNKNKKPEEVHADIYEIVKKLI